jgi:hypothetical protein
MKFSSKLYVAALTLALAPATSWALAISFGGSGTTAGLPLGARADFTTSANEIDLVLTNTLGIGDIRSSVQAISDITFTIVPSVVPLTGTGTAAGQFGDLTGNPTPGIVTYQTTDSQTGNTTPIRWIAGFSNTGTTITLEALGGGMPSQMILPFIANGGTYTNANNGIQNFNSYVIGPGTFDLSIPGITADTTITSVTFSFGTGTGAETVTIPGTPLPSVPEPATLGLIGLGLAALGLSRKRKH